MKDAPSPADRLPAAPGPCLIHVAGDLVVRLGSNPSNGMARMLSAALENGAAPTAQAATGDPTPLKILADGSQIDASDPRTDHVALLFPDTGWMVAVTALSNAGEPFGSQQETEDAAKSLGLLGYHDWTLAIDKVYERHVIDRRYHQPAADKNLYPNLPLSDWYWTSTAAPWSAESAFVVDLHIGDVYDLHRNGSGFGLACRRARQ